jgi:DNA polymerase-3 subunit epsilon
MITLDVETGGLIATQHALLSIGAVDYTTGDEFYIECRAGSALELDDKALAVNGFTREQALDPAKPFRDVAYVRFLDWCKGRDCLVGGQQVGAFDLNWLKQVHVYTESAAKAENYVHYEDIKGITAWPFGHRSVDLHSVAYAKLGKSLSLDGILQALGLTPEPKPHNALTGARLERDAFKLLLA